MLFEITRGHQGYLNTKLLHGQNVYQRIIKASKKIIKGGVKKMEQEKGNKKVNIAFILVAILLVVLITVGVLILLKMNNGEMKQTVSHIGDNNVANKANNTTLNENKNTTVQNPNSTAENDMDLG